jgi:hypothetical protein
MNNLLKKDANFREWASQTKMQKKQKAPSPF